jgi:nucleotide-binding universal stress UspA family protein
MSAPAEIAIFLNSTGENDTLAGLIAALPLADLEKVWLLVLDEELPAYTAFPEPSRKRRLEEIIRSANLTQIEKVTSLLGERASGTVEVVHLKGRFPTALVDWVNRSQVELVVKESLPCDVEFGNASKGDVKLARQVDQLPCLLMHAPIIAGQPVFVGVPPIHTDQSGLKLAVKVIRAAAEWAQVLNAPLHLVRAWTLFGENLLVNRASPEELAETLTDERDRAQAELDSAIEQAGLPESLEYEAHLYKGDPTRVLNAKIELLKPALVVMGSVANDGIKGVLLGNTAESIVRKQDASVLIVR